MYRDLQINRLRALVTVVDVGGFRKAADVLHVTQPAVSQQIRQLSTLIKRPIFVSTGRDLQLSPEGEELLGYARRIVSLNDEAVDRFVPASGENRLSIGVSDQLAETLPEILRGLSSGLPQTQISVRTGLSETLEAHVQSGLMDLALLLQPRTQPAAGATGATVHEFGHLRLDWFGEPVQARGAKGVPLTLFTEPSSLRSRILDTFDASNTPWRVGYEGNELVGLRAAAKAGMGVACLVANGDRLWGLEKTRGPQLPEPPEPMAVSMAVSGVAAGATVARKAQRALANALSEYPFAA